MTNSWLRLWHDMPNDPKWRTIARKSNQRIGDVISVYLHVLVNASIGGETQCNASETQGVTSRNKPERGKIKNLCADDIASSLDLETEQVEQILAAMQGKVLDGDLVIGWAKRQPKKEDNSTQRVRAFRDKKRAEKEAEANIISGTRNAGETQCNAGETQGNAPDTDTDKDLKDLNPTHNARVRESAPTSQSGSTQQPVVTKPEYLGDLNEPIGKFSMTADWHPSLDFRRRAALWGVALPEPEFTPAELTAFRDYWASEGKVFTQIQWEQKFAHHVNHVRAKAKPASRGENHAGIQPDSTASRAVQQIRAAREQWERRNGIVSVGDDLETLGSHGGDLLEPLDPEERNRTL